MTEPFPRIFPLAPSMRLRRPQLSVYYPGFPEPETQQFAISYYRKTRL